MVCVSPTPRPLHLPHCAAAAAAELIDLYKQSDPGATAALLGKLCVERSYSTKLDDVRSGEERSGAGIDRLVHSLLQLLQLMKCSLIADTTYLSSCIFPVQTACH